MEINQIGKVISSKLEFETRVLTPEDAKELLVLNTNNRKVSKAKVDEYAKKMLLGKWMENNGDTIRISVRKVILDAQHRLHALAKLEGEDVKIAFNFLTGLEDDTFSTIDTGKKRNASDVLSIAGFSVKVCKTFASSARAIMSYQLMADNLEAEKHFRMDAKSKKFVRKTPVFQNQDILEYVQENVTLFEDGYNIIVKNKDSFPSSLSVSQLLFMYIMLTKKGKDGNLFAVQLITGINTLAGSPVDILREELSKNDALDKTDKNRLTKNESGTLAIIAWNHFALDNSMSRKFFKKDTICKLTGKTEILDYAGPSEDEVEIFEEE